ncbi:Alpha-glucosidase [Ascochyta rabiei]|uniref:Alpha-glucosidase n=1 Tax=Didymella rabiei TaxID=5454 RepID=UPI0018FF2310|nr:Alpha-glucosidase [Ascochyta rabiei]UPX15643.1 Alpha-glucosidase [Ascochyta rabiei]
MFGKSFLALAVCARVSFAAPFLHDATSLVHTRAADPSTCPGYTATNVDVTDAGLTADLTLAGAACNAYSEDLQDLKLVVEHQTDDRLHVKIYDAGLNMFQVQEEVMPRPANNKVTSTGAAIRFDIVAQPFSFKVVRNSNNETIFDTAGTPLIFEKQYVRLRTNLPTDPNLYGLGEHSDSFRFHTKDYRRSLLNAESINVPNNANLYGSHPVYFDHRGDKGTHGVFLLNSSPMNIDIDQDAAGNQYLEYNTIGGVLDLYFLAGPAPADVSKQYADVVGYSAMYPYWTLGFHQCKYGYWDVNMVAEVVANYSSAGIPLEVMWTDIDYMDARQDFTLDPERFPLAKMKELVSTLHSRDQRYVLILDPGVHAFEEVETYKRGHDLDIFLKAADGTDLLGVQWPGAVAWPDWFHPNAQKWWTDEVLSFFDADSGVNIDGIWVDMNEASNFCENTTCAPREKAIADGIPPKPAHGPRPNTGRPIPGFPSSFQPTSSKRDLESRQAMGQMKGFAGREWFDPAYKVTNHLGNVSDYTIWFNTSNYDGTHQYDTHNFYGHMMAMTTQQSMITRRPEVRPFVLTRSTFAGTGRKVTHWFGDNASDWEHYRTSIRQMLSFVSMHQMPLVGSDVCGFNGNTDEQLCARWAMLGAFQPFYRNHAELSTIQQEFYIWPSVAAAAKKAIDTRYKLLDYLYTALYYQTTEGTPMINPLFFLYPTDSATFGIQEQWFYGDSLLISPVTTDYSDTVTFYLPADTFYDYWTHERVLGTGSNITLSNLTTSDIPVHIRGGAILPERATSANTTKALRTQDFALLVAPAADGSATGRLYLDEGERIEQPNVSEIEFKFADGKFTASGTFAYSAAEGESITVASVLVLGQTEAGATGTFDAEEGSVRVDGPWVLNRGFEFQL